MEAENIFRNESKRTIHRVPSLRTRRDICANLPDEDFSYEVDHLALNRMPRSSRVVKLKDGPKNNNRKTLREAPKLDEYPEDLPTLVNFAHSSRQEDHEASWGEMSEYDTEDTEDTSTRHVIYSKFGIAFSFFSVLFFSVLFFSLH